MITREAKAETTHRAELELGPPIANGIVRWVSSTLITSADTSSEGGCLRRVWFERVGGQDRVTTAAMTAGVGMHAEIQEFLETGNRNALGPIALAGYHLIPEPGAGLIVEQPIILGGNGVITGVWLRAAGVPVAGHVDLFNFRGQYIDAQGDLRIDPTNTVEVKDWKSTSDLKWAKSADQVAHTIQMNLYASAAFRMWPTLEHARLTHVYFQRNGRPQAKLATKFRERAEVDARWAYAESVVRNVLDVARETNPNKVDANTKACHSYNQPCPHLASGLCEAGKRAQNHNSLADILGPSLAAAVNNAQQKKDNDMGLLSRVAPPGAEATVTLITPPAGVGVAVSLDDLVAEETASRIALDAPVAGPQPLPATPEFQACLGPIFRSNLGFPKLVGRAALMFATLNMKPLAAGMEIEASGRLAKLEPIEDPAGLVKLSAEIVAKYPDTAKAPNAVTAPTPAAAVANPITPPDMPASNPALAADPVEGLDNAKTRELAAAQAAAATGTPVTTPAPELKPPAGITADMIPVNAMPQVPAVGSTETIAPAASAAPATDVVATETAAKKKRGRPEGSKNKTKGEGATEVASGTAFNIFIDAIPEGLEFEAFDDYVDALCATLCEATGAIDVRAAPENSPLGYSKWRGTLSALARENPPKPGNYVTRTRGNEIAELVASALRAQCIASGGTFVMGVR